MAIIRASRHHGFTVDARAVLYRERRRRGKKVARGEREARCPWDRQK